MRKVGLISLTAMALGTACAGPEPEPISTETTASGIGTTFVAHLNQRNTNNIANNRTLSLSPVAAVAAGNTIIVTVSAGLSTPAVSTEMPPRLPCTDSQGNVYTVRAEAGGTSLTDPYLYICSAYVTHALGTTDTITVNYPIYTGVALMSADEYGGVGAFDQQSGAIGNSTSLNSGNVTTTSANELLFVGLGMNGSNVKLNAGASYAFPSGNPVTFGGSSNPRTLTLEHRLVNAIGTYAGDATIRPPGPATPWRAALATFQQDLTAPTVTVVSAVPNPTAAGTIVTWNGDEISSFLVRVGGTSCTSGGTVVDSGSYPPAGMSPGVDHATTINAADLASGNNTVRVCLTDTGSNIGSATLTVNHDISPPVVVIDSVLPNPTASAPTLTFHADENGSYSLRLGGGNCASGSEIASGAYSTAPATAQFSVPVDLFVEGGNFVRLCLTDSVGNIGETSTTITLDGTAPTVTIDTRSPNPTSGGSNITWHASENGTYSVRVGGTGCADGTQVDSGTYSTAPATVISTVNSGSLAEGTNTIRVCVADSLSNTGSSVTTVDKDSTAPVVTIDSATPNPTASGTTITWHAGESGSFTVRLGGSDCSSGTNVESGPTYTAPSSHSTVIDTSLLNEGMNTVRICVIDAVFNAGNQTVVVTKDTTAPVVNITGVSPDPTMGSTTVTWTGSESGNFTVRVGGTDCSTGVAAVSGSYSGAPGPRASVIPAASLAEGSNTLRVCLTDATSNQGSAASSVVKDTTAPTVVIDSITPNPTSDSTTVMFHANENGSYSVRLGGSSCANGTVVETGAYSGAPTQASTFIPEASLPDGTTTIRVCVSDAAGNGGATTGSVVKNSTAPVVRVVCAAPTSDDATVTWHADQAGTYSVRVGGSDCTDGVEVETGSYPGTGDQSSTVPVAELAEGLNALVVCVTNNLSVEGFDQSFITFHAPQSVDLASESAERTFLGAASGTEFGNLTLGDVNGDGIADLIAAEHPGRNAAGTVIRRNAGTAYGYLGGATFLDGSTTTIPATPDFRIIGGDASDDLGVRNNGNLKAGLDVTGDGWPDLVISAPGADGVGNARSNAGEIYVLSGAALTGTIDLTGDSLPAVVFMRIIGPVAGGAAQILAVRDANGDGIADLLIGVPLADPSGMTDAGEAFLVAGGSGGTIDLSTASVLARFRGAAAGDLLGSTGDIGDFGGTTDSDVLLGAPINNGYRGAAYGVFGPFSGSTYDFGAGDEDVRFESSSAARLGQTVAVANVTGSPRGDVILGGRRLAAPGNVAVGGAVVFAGPVAGGSLHVVDNPGAYGGANAVILGENLDDNLGAAFSYGDIDADGYDDLLLGAYRKDGPTGMLTKAGSGYMVMGGQCMAPSTNFATAVPAYVVYGAIAGGNLGRYTPSIGVGDLNGDFVTDFCLSASSAGTGRVDCFMGPW